MKILIIGGTRFIGKKLLNLINKKNNKITVISNSKRKKPSGLRYINLNREKGIQKLKHEHFDLCFDFISYKKSDPYDLLKNVIISKYIFISTTWIPMYFKMKANKICRFSSKRINQKNIRPETINYLKGKINAELELKKYKALGYNVYIVRLPITLGDNDHTKRLDFYFNKIKKNKKIFLYKNLDNYVQLCWNEDIARALLIWSKKDLTKKNDLIWEFLPLESIKLNKLIQYICLFSKTKFEYSLEKLKNIQKNYSNYLYDEPFYRENKMKLTNNNIFKYIKYKPANYKFFIKKILNKNYK